MARPGRGVAQRAGALALACLTGCYTTTGRARIARDVPEQVETRSNGTHLGLSAVEAEPGRPVIAAQVLDMCRAQERGQRTYDIALHQTKSNLSGGGGGHPAFLILAPLFILVGIFHLASPEHAITVRPSEEPPVPYTAWRGPRAPCGGPGRPAAAVPLALVLRQSATRCAGWLASTGPDGLLPLAEALDPAAAAPASCDRLGENGLLLVEAVQDAERTSDQLRLPLPPALSAALGVEARETPPPDRAGWERVKPEILRTCAPHLASVCLGALAACDREAEEKGDVPAARQLCAYEALRCEPRSSAFDGCAGLVDR